MATDKDGKREGSDGEVLVRHRLESHYRAHAGWLGRMLRFRFGARPEEAEDLVQETYIRMARYADGSRDSQPRLLLLTIARNLVRDTRRRAEHRYRASDTDGLEPGDLLPVEPDQAEQLLLKQIVLGIPEPYRDAFILSRYTAMTYEQIAAHLGITVKAVEWRLAKALEHCAAQLRY